MRPDEKQPGFVLCVHCGEYEGKVACRGCRYLVCGACALADCPEAVAPSTNEPGRFYAEPVALDAATRTIQCNGQRARFDAVLEVIVETVVARGGELPFEYAVRLVLGDRPGDFVVTRIRSAHPMRDLDALVTARGDKLARAIGVRLRIERG